MPDSATQLADRGDLLLRRWVAAGEESRRANPARVDPGTLSVPLFPLRLGCVDGVSLALAWIGAVRRRTLLSVHVQRQFVQLAIDI